MIVPWSSVILLTLKLAGCVLVYWFIIAVLVTFVLGALGSNNDEQE